MASSSQEPPSPAPEYQDSGKSYKITSPLSDQLWFSITRNPPRKTPHFLRTLQLRLWQPPAPPVVKGLYITVPADWCVDNSLGNSVTYFSNEKSFQKMYQRRNFYRTFIQDKEVILEMDVENFGTPVDYWLTYPLNMGQDIWATGPLICTRYTLNRYPGSGLQRFGGLPMFPWATNSTGTNMRTLQSILLSRDIEKIAGFVECPKCKKFCGIGYGLKRFFVAKIHYERIMGQIKENNQEDERLLQRSHFDCKCDGKQNPVKPFISDELSKINWMFLFLGFGLGYCSMEQLRYYCNQRELEILGVGKNVLLFNVSKDLIDQLGTVNLFEVPTPSPANQDSGNIFVSDIPENQDSGHSIESRIPENRDSCQSYHESQCKDSMLPPISPQLLFSLTRKPPRIFPRTQLSLPRPLPPLPTVNSSNSYMLVPSNWCIDNRVAGNGGTYLSRDNLLLKMFQRCDLYRTCQSNFVDGNMTMMSPMDYMLTFPLKNSRRTESSSLPRIQLSSNATEVSVSGPFLSTRKTLNRHPGMGRLPFDGLQFPWVTNSSSTKMCTLETLMSNKIDKFTGFVHCPKCSELWGIGYSLEEHKAAALYIALKKEEVKKNVDNILRESPFDCMCNGYGNAGTPVRPFICDDDFSKINWMFLFTGLGLGFCKKDQLRYYCKHRKLEMSEDKNWLTFLVCKDIVQQVLSNLFLVL